MEDQLPKVPQDRELNNEEIEEYAIQVMNGQFGDDEERKANLGNKYEIIQKKVNDIMEYNLSVITNWRENIYRNAEFSMNNELSLEEMRERFGYLFPLIQCEKNEMEGNDLMFNIRDKDIENLANEAIDGTFGNGNERKYRLDKLYENVQKKVQEILDKKVELELQLSY